MKTYILGISAYYHDSAACLLIDGQIIAAAQEERFTRKKHDFAFPIRAIQYCLKQAGITAADLSYVGFYDKPFLKFERLLLTYLNTAPLGLRSFLQAMPLWLKEKLYIKDLIKEELNYDGEILFPEHHESHAASAFFPSPFHEAAVLTIDGVGEWSTTSLGSGKGNKVSLLKDIEFPHSVGLLYSAFTYYVGFRVNSGEYKLMGLAPYGEPKYVNVIKEHLIDIKDDGSFKLNMNYFDYCAGLKMTNAKFHQLFGRGPRTPETAISQMDMDIARSIQAVTEEVMLKMANFVYEETGSENLCLAGGVALNCVGNGKILRESRFKNIWIQPAAGDAGGSLGAATLIWHHYLNKDRSSKSHQDKQSGSYLGPDYQQEIDEFVSVNECVGEKYEKDALMKEAARLIADENVVGLFQGRMEFGPRALGSRSILGDARSTDMQTKLNLKIKFRESFRPFAPSVLYEKVHEYFELNAESPYMLLVADVNKKKLIKSQNTHDAEGIEKLKIQRSVIPAVTHVDNSARIQTVHQETNPFFYGILEAFYEQTGCPVIINTSFNIRGEPIVCTPQDAYRCFMCTNMDYLIMGDYLFSKAEQLHQKKYPLESISRVLD